MLGVVVIVSGAIVCLFALMFVAFRGYQERHPPRRRPSDTPRGWRLDKLKSRDTIDAVVALAMAVESAETPTPAVTLLGWL